MSANQRPRQQRDYYQIIGGKFSKKVDAGTEGATKRVNKENATVHELYYDDITGEIKSLEIRKGNYGDQLIIEVHDADEISVIQLPTNSRYFNSFCDKLENINFIQDVKIVPYDFTSKTEKNVKGEPKRIMGLNIYHSNEKVGNYYSKDNQGNKPSYPQTPTERNLKVYYMDVEDYFKQLVEQVNLKIPDSKTVKHEMEDIPANIPIENDAPVEDDGLPF